jgi:hypothetical protein
LALLVGHVPLNELGTLNGLEVAAVIGLQKTHVKQVESIALRLCAATK